MINLGLFTNGMIFLITEIRYFQVLNIYLHFFKFSSKGNMCTYCVHKLDLMTVIWRLTDCLPALLTCEWIVWAIIMKTCKLALSWSNCLGNITSLPPSHLIENNSDWKDALVPGCMRLLPWLLVLLVLPLLFQFPYCPATSWKLMKDKLFTVAFI